MIHEIQDLFGENDVVNITSSDTAWYEHPMFKVSQFKTKIKLLLRNYIGHRSEEKEKKWFEDGVDCELLKTGAKSWQKGKIRLKFQLEFIPDEPEAEEIFTDNNAEINLTDSDLDEIRQKIKQAN